MATIIVICTYIAAQMLSDIMSLKIVSFLGMSMDAGTLVYPITFTLRDLVHKTIGKQKTRWLIVIAAGINVVMAGLFWLTSTMPYDASAGPQPDWDSVLSPVWRIVVASIVAEVISELMDTETYHLWVTWVTARYQWMRVLLSNAVSVPIDSLVFCWLAFGGGLPSAVVWSIFGANVLLKGACTLLSLPLIYTVKERQ